MLNPFPPREPGRWKRLDHDNGKILWRRDRDDPVPVTMFYLLAPGRQAEIFYDEALARQRFADLAFGSRNTTAS